MSSRQIPYTACAHMLIACAVCQAATLAPASRIEWEGTSGRSMFHDLSEGTPLSGVLAWDHWQGLRLDIDFPSGWEFDGMRAQNGGIEPVYYPVYFEADAFDSVTIQSPSTTLSARDFSGQLQDAGTGTISVRDRRTGYVLEIEVSGFSIYETGDSTKDGVFNQLDIVHVLAAGKYMSGQPATWSDGDWTGNGLFDQWDIIRALPRFGVVHEEAQAFAPVPEPSALWLAVCGLFGAALLRRFYASSRHVCRGPLREPNVISRFA